MNPETGGLKILVIDDSPFYRQILQGALLGMDGVREVQTAEDGEKAIRMVLASPPDAITLDLKMPGMDGFTFLRWLMKNHPIPVLVISSEGEGKNVFKALDLGALDFIVKPPPRASVRMEGIREELKEKIAAIAGSDLPSRLARFSSGRKPVEEAGGGPSVAVSLPAAVPGVG
ncbi:MAG: response regulator, partial [Proteobacteria bacterium]|nr:response regulator [Pseudomonadota bacterium]